MTKQDIPECTSDDHHSWGKWIVINSKTASDMNQAITHQCRICKICGYCQVDLQRLMLK